jgi:hypothetical protein
MTPRPYWNPGTKVRIIETGEVGLVDYYKGDGFYKVFVEHEGQAAYFTLHVENLELINDDVKT